MEMKKILMAAVALICMTMTSVVFTSCGDNKEDTKIVIFYKYADLENMQCLQTEEGRAQFQAFNAALVGVLSSIESREVSDEDVIEMTQSVVDMYNNKMIDGTFKLQRSRNASEWITVQRFTINANSQYSN